MLAVNDFQAFEDMAKTVDGSLGIGPLHVGESDKREFALDQQADCGVVAEEPGLRCRIDRDGSLEGVARLSSFNKNWSMRNR